MHWSINLNTFFTSALPRHGAVEIHWTTTWYVCVFTSVQQLIGEAKFSDGTIAESAIELTFEVVDDNDNPPVFGRIPPATVKESSPAGKEMLSANNT